MSSSLTSRIWYEFDSNSLETVELSNGQAVIYSRRCPTRDSTPNEDAACIVEVAECQSVLAVADGVGGGMSGNKASRCVIEQLARACLEGTDDSRQKRAGLRCQIIDAIETANDEILSWGVGAATTMTAVELKDGNFRYFHVGDSGALITSNRGTIRFSTVGHAPVAQAVAIGMLDSKEAIGHVDQNLITNCVGCSKMRIEFGIFQPVSIRDTLIIASDGLFDNLTKQEIADFIRKGSLIEQVNRLVQAAESRMEDEAGKPDDLTVICFRKVGK